jgi:hypothetical protein
MLCQFQQETCHREGFDLSFEEFVVGRVVDHSDLSDLLDTDLFQRQRGRAIRRAMYWQRASRVLEGPTGMCTEASTMNLERLQLIKLVAILYN